MHTNWNILTYIFKKIFFVFYNLEMPKDELKMDCESIIIGKKNLKINFLKNNHKGHTKLQKQE